MDTDQNALAGKPEFCGLRRPLSLPLSTSDILLPGGKNGALEQVVPGNWRGTIQKHRLRASNDVERSRRVIRFLFRNWLAQVDKPDAERARRRRVEDFWLYEFDRSVPDKAREISPETIDRAIDETLFARLVFGQDDRAANMNPSAIGAWEGDGFFARERKRRSVLLVKLAAELYRREKGRAPATAGELLGGYLKELPEGISGDDAIPARVE